MNKFETIVVDDEPEAREGLVQSLEKDPQIKLYGTCSNGFEAIETINSGNIDIVLLDIQMPEINGFEVLANINVHPVPMVIFITAYDQFAIKAFEYHAVDYLLKPYTEERLMKALQYAKKRLGEDRLSNNRLIHDLASQFVVSDDSRIGGLIWNRDQQLQHNQRIAVKSNGIIHFFSLSEVMYFEGFNAYVKINLTNDRHFLINNRLKLIGSLCDPRSFLRTHKSFIINADYIDVIHPGFSGDYTITLKNGEQLKGSRNYRNSVDSFLLKK